MMQSDTILVQRKRPRITSWNGNETYGGVKHCIYM